MNVLKQGNRIICRKLAEYDLNVLDRFVDSRNVGEAQDATVARVMSRFNKNVTFTPDAIEQIDARVKARKAANLAEYQWVMGGH